MAYDKKTGTINIGAKDSQKDFEQDLFAHFAHVEREVSKELQARKKANSLSGRLKNLSKRTKTGIAIFVFWTAWVLFRTADDYEILGIWLDNWDDKYFFLNWLGFPIVLSLLYATYCWIAKDKNQPVPRLKKNPLEDFERDIATWPANQRQCALLIIKAILDGDQKSIDKLYGELTLEQLRKVKAVVEKMEKK